MKWFAEQTLADVDSVARLAGVTSMFASGQKDLKWPLRAKTAIRPDHGAFGHGSGASTGSALCGHSALVGFCETTSPDQPFKQHAESSMIEREHREHSRPSPQLTCQESCLEEWTFISAPKFAVGDAINGRSMRGRTDLTAEPAPRARR
jgi:hypothetical protein